MDRRLKVAVVLALILQLPLVAIGRYRLSYDAYTHIFFADHYTQNWWSLWEPRWYTGFSVASYPPLTHQLIALLSFPLGLELAFASLLLLVLVALPVSVFAFARIFISKAAAGYAAIFAALLPSVYLAAHTFGQLPTLAGSLFVLLALAFLAQYLRFGRPIDAFCAAALVTVTVTAHHGTLLFLPWGAAAILLHLYLTRQSPLKKLFGRSFLFALMAGAASLVVIWPFWQWGLSQTMQTPIDHLSRHNFFREPRATLFFWPAYGWLVLLIPWMLRQLRSRRRVSLAGLFLLLFILGLGGTTPLPRLLYGSGWAWLTYDRFALWASVMLLPFVGLVVVRIRRHYRLGKLRLLQTPLVQAAGLAAMTAFAWIVAFIPSILPTQPDPIPMQPIVDFLAEEDRAQWRYLTFGFGDQLAYLSVLTPAETIDGSYHTARELPELRTSGIGQIDSAYWSPLGVNALDPILEKAGAHGVRWAFVNHAAYAPILARHRWVSMTRLSNQVVVWENPRAVIPAKPGDMGKTDRLAAISWGSLPLLSLLAAAGSIWWRSRLPG